MSCEYFLLQTPQLSRLSPRPGALPFSLFSLSLLSLLSFLSLSSLSLFLSLSLFSLFSLSLVSFSLLSLVSQSLSIVRTCWIDNDGAAGRAHADHCRRGRLHTPRRKAAADAAGRDRDRSRPRARGGRGHRPRPPRARHRLRRRGADQRVRVRRGQRAPSEPSRRPHRRHAAQVRVHQSWWREPAGRRRGQSGRTRHEGQRTQRLG